MDDFLFYPAILGLSTKTECYSSMLKTSLELEDQHMFLNVLNKTEYETKLLLQCVLDIVTRKDYEVFFGSSCLFFCKVIQNSGFDFHNQIQILKCWLAFLNSSI